MKKYDPIQYTRTIWYDQRKIKNHPRNCKEHHRFCSLDYEWKDNNLELDHLNRPINHTIQNVTLPASKQKGLIKYEDMTEQALDDWVAQSMNRTLISILNPNKKFFLPTNLDEEMKIRYRKLRKSLKPQPDDSYFKTRQHKSEQKSYLTHKKNKTIDLSDLAFDYKQLQPKKVLGKSFIQARQNSNKLQKPQVKRRNAVLLQRDIHYQHFVRQQRLNNANDFKVNIDEQRKVTQQLNKNKIYTFNYESIRRRKQNQSAPNSITEYQGINIKLQDQKFSLQRGNRKEMLRQEEQQEAYRLKGNAQAEQAYSIMQNFSERTRRTKRTKISSSEQKSKPQRNQRMVSMRSLLDMASLNTKKTQKKLPVQKINLGKNVMKLLDDMHVQSQKINALMAQFQLHPQFLQLKIIQKQNMSHKWIKKAQEEIHKNNMSKAFDCYKQALILSPDFFNPVYNFATILQRENRLNCSLQWFKLARNFQSDNERVTFAIALINLKMQKFEASFAQINELINCLSSQKKKIDIRYYYIRALCHKKFQKHESAKQDYKLVLNESKPIDYAHFTNHLFSQIIAKKRRLKVNVDCLSYVNFQQACMICLFQKENKLKEEGIDQLVNKICHFRFFRRFPSSLVHKIVKSAIYEHISKDQIIFIRPDECVIILDGLAIVKNHQKNVLFHKNTTFLRSGDFIGANKIDNFINLNLNNWFLAHTDLELLRLKSLQFQSLWKGQITFQIDYKYNFLKNNPLFDNLSEATLFKLCELMKIQKYPQGTVLLNDASYKIQTVSKLGVGFSLVRESVQLKNISQHIAKSSTIPSQQEFNKIQFSGLFVVLKGKIQIQDNLGFSNGDIIIQGDFFGQNLILKCDGFHNYGRLLVSSQEAQFYVLSVQDIIWFFSSQDKQKMTKNCQNMEKRRSLQLIKDLRKRYHEYLDIKRQFKTDYY